MMLRAPVLLASALLASALRAAPAVPAHLRTFIEERCVECHDDIEKKGGLDLTALAFDLKDAKNFTAWLAVHDRIAAGEMPPKKKTAPPAKVREAFLHALAGNLTAAERAQEGGEGRATRRRLNRYEYENALRDLLQAPWLQVKEWLPEDGERYRFNKSGEALDVSHVQMARYLGAADYALRQVMPTRVDQPAKAVTRYYARDQRSFTGPMKFSVFNTAPERATFPVLDRAAQVDVRAGKAPITVGAKDPAQRELEGVGVVASAYEPLEPKFSSFKAPVAGRYRLRFNALSVWVGPTKAVPGKPDRWYIPDLDQVAPGRRSEPITVYSEIPPRQLRQLGVFDVSPEPSVQELEVWLLTGETIRPDAARFFRSRPGASRWQNPLAERDGQPGVVFRWLEVEGPIYDRWPTTAQTLLFGDLPLRPAASGGGLEVVTTDPRRDARRLITAFLARAYRRPVPPAEVERFLPVIEHSLKEGNRFAEAMLAGYTAVLCSPEFVTVNEQPGRLDDYAVASRLALFLSNSTPDDELRALATRGGLREPKVLRAQAERLLNDPKSRRFTDAFLDYWLDLRRIVATAPDETLYPDYYLDDHLAESALEESQLFFRELLHGDLPARHLVASDFAMLNEKLAAHYRLPPVDGVKVRRVALPPDSVRGGLLTQAAVLKVTANGTTTSPVLRGVWINERLLGQPPPPPPASVPAVEPDIRGASTIRQQLQKHSTQESCATCHIRIDPPGFALEGFDVMGGLRSRYRAMGEGAPEVGLGRGGQKFAFHLALPVDSTGEMPDGRTFEDVRQFKRRLLENERVIARNLVRQFIVFATGAPVRFNDRAAVERILDQAKAGGYGVRSLLHGVIQSDLFLQK